MDTRWLLDHFVSPVKGIQELILAFAAPFRPEISVLFASGPDQHVAGPFQICIDATGRVFVLTDVEDIVSLEPHVLRARFVPHFVHHLCVDPRHANAFFLTGLTWVGHYCANVTVWHTYGFTNIAGLVSDSAGSDIYVLQSSHGLVRINTAAPFTTEGLGFGDVHGGTFHQALADVQWRVLDYDLSYVRSEQRVSAHGHTAWSSEIWTYNIHSVTHRRVWCGGDTPKVMIWITPKTLVLSLSRSVILVDADTGRVSVPDEHKGLVPETFLPRPGPMKYVVDTERRLLYLCGYEVQRVSLAPSLFPLQHCCAHDV